MSTPLSEYVYADGTVCCTEEELAAHRAMVTLRREARRWARVAGNRRSVDGDDFAAAYRVARAAAVYAEADAACAAA